jgi:AAA+ ATPase superfamily predicted ATPase
MKNPFNYLQFATGDGFYDRHEIRADLRSRFLSGQTNVVLYGPRRYGKSSLVAELISDLEKEGVQCVSIDVMKTPTIDLFVSAYVSKIYKKLAPVKFEFKRLGEFLKSLRFKMTIGADGEPGFSMESAQSRIGPETLEEVLDLPRRLVSANKRAVIVLDEFQEVEELLSDGQFERTMRSVIQCHRNISYIFLGSRYHMLRRMFTDRNRPFYKSAIAIMLDKPPFEESLDFVVSRFESCGKTISRQVAGQLVQKIDNIPYYIQQLGFEVFRLVDDAKRKVVSSDDVEAAYRLLSGFNRDQYEQLTLTFSGAQKKLLIALAHERTREFDDDYRSRYLLGASSTVNSAKKILMEYGHIERMEDKYSVADPYFARYLRGD